MSISIWPSFAAAAFLVALTFHCLNVCVASRDNTRGGCIAIDDLGLRNSQAL
jgi:hypothetical protein